MPGTPMAKRRKTPPILRKRPEQDRSRATVEAILEAAARILARDGYGGFTTNHVAAKAGVSVGTLYQYFPNKESLLGELIRRHRNAIEDGIEEVAPRAQDLPFEDVVRAAIEQVVCAHLVDPALHRVLSETPPLGKVDWEATFGARLTAQVKAAFAARRSEIVVPDLDLAVYVAMRAVEAVIHNAATERLSDLKSGALTQEVTRMLLGYLTGRATPVTPAARETPTRPG
ncbi:TetR/AcrR family transcriptional regulator [Reyranella sp. CPCC 100927]|uniref:TetR/AcrR family transcriptional regulator n=1 Tax=Reyranella sp. CPCC 100927 TaxID=2599616 RepID=UPI0011B3D4F6|nr:TetR/AcrR family transcriptional regulator [Reyranella sp. CPCC 100927]TWT01683.1 TetR/AcrR family transcriptional regulator [Reyranella sp. CPCC 100927]